MHRVDATVPGCQFGGGDGVTMDEKCVGQMQLHDSVRSIGDRSGNGRKVHRVDATRRLMSCEAIGPTAGHCMQQTFPAIATTLCSVTRSNWPHRRALHAADFPSHCHNALLSHAKQLAPPQVVGPTAGGHRRALHAADFFSHCHNLLLSHAKQVAPPQVVGGDRPCIFAGIGSGCWHGRDFGSSHP